MAVGQHQAVGRDHDAGAEPAALARARQSGSGLDPHDGGADAFGNVDDGIGISIEQTRIIRGSRLGGLQRYPSVKWVAGKFQHGKIPSRPQIVTESCRSKRPCNARSAATDEEQAVLNRALVIAARSRQPDGTDFFKIEFAVARRPPRRTSTRGATVRPFAMTKVSDRAGPAPAWPVQDLASSRLGATSLHGQDRPLAHARGALRGGLAFVTAALGIELFLKRKRPRRG